LAKGMPGTCTVKRALALDTEPALLVIVTV
jgi:hypothetical protein